MNEEKIYEDVVKAAFAKAQQTQIPNQKYKLASYLTTEIQEIAHIILAVLFITGVLLSVHLSRQKECMIWVVDHYETIDCSVAQPQEQPQYVIDRVISSKIDQFHSVTVTE